MTDGDTKGPETVGTRPSHRLNLFLAVHSEKGNILQSYDVGRSSSRSGGLFHSCCRPLSLSLSSFTTTITFVATGMYNVFLLSPAPTLTRPSPLQSRQQTTVRVRPMSKSACAFGNLFAVVVVVAVDVVLVGEFKFCLEFNSDPVIAFAPRIAVMPFASHRM